MKKFLEGAVDTMTKDLPGAMGVGAGRRALWADWMRAVRRQPGSLIEIGLSNLHVFVS